MEHKELFDEEKKFVDVESDFVNGRLHHKKEVAEALASDHRYLVGQKGLLYIEFFRVLANNYENGLYDDRNEYVCKCAKVMIDALVKEDVYWIPKEMNR